MTVHLSLAPKPFSVRARLRGFRHAFRGVATLIRSQHNAWIHLGATVGAVGAAAGWRISGLEWCAVVLAIGGVWAAEAINTGLEFLADEVSGAPRELIGKAKDLGAAGVLLSSFAAAAVGAIVFGPRVLALLSP